MISDRFVSIVGIYLCENLEHGKNIKILPADIPISSVRWFLLPCATCRHRSRWQGVYSQVCDFPNTQSLSWVSQPNSEQSA